MGRKKKEETPEVVETKEVKKEKTAPKEPFKILASFRVFVKDEGVFQMLDYNSEGETLEEALEAIEFPKGINSNIRITVSRGDTEITRAVASHKAQAILVDKDIVSLEAMVRGVF